MRRVLPLVAVAILLIGVAGVFAITQANQQAQARASAAPPSVGEFVLRYARTVRLAGDSSTPAQALEALRAAGLAGSQTVGLDAALTEGDVVRLTEKMNLDIETDNPGREFSRRQADTFFDVFGPVLESGGNPLDFLTTADAEAHDSHVPNPNAADPRLRGKGKKKGLSPHFPFP